MRVVREADVPFNNHDTGPRGGGLAFKHMLTGREGTLDNYLWVIAKSDGARYSPRHRHNFDQVRYSLQGDLSIGTRKTVKEGEVGYFPEGTHYGPQDDAGQARTTLVLQFAGASGQGYMSQEQVARAQRELKQFGTFEKGIYHRTDGKGRKNQDGFEALWEHVNGKKLVYPKQRYQEPVISDPRNFDWRPTEQDGVTHKNLGVFTERETRLGFFKLEPGAVWAQPREHAIRLSFVVSGCGTCGGTAYEDYTCVEGAPGDEVTFTAERPSEIFQIVIPSYE
jgi:hypothetical protein